ncbi:MAG: biotin/lipoyl-binding protein [Saprospiraceae bacterium]|nr:biotin/lipoyl-binding protein [Saprospiraceae bacterium]
MSGISTNEIKVKGFADMKGLNDSDSFSVLVQNGNKIKVRFKDKIYNAIIRKSDIDRKEFNIIIDGFTFVVKIEEPLDQLISQLGFRELKVGSVKEIKSPMPGLVADVVVKPGDIVEAGEKLLSLEAMKMENIIKSISAGTVKNVFVEKGNSIEKNQILIEFE